jgi:hypothetical protein
VLPQPCVGSINSYIIDWHLFLQQDSIVRHTRNAWGVCRPAAMGLATALALILLRSTSVMCACLSCSSACMCLLELQQCMHVHA